MCLCGELRSEVDPSAHLKRRAGVPAASRGNAAGGENARASQGRRTQRTLARKIPQLAVVATGACRGSGLLLGDRYYPVLSQLGG